MRQTLFFILLSLCACFTKVSKPDRPVINRIKIFGEYLQDTSGSKITRISIYITEYKKLLLYELPYDTIHISNDKLVYVSEKFDKFIFNPESISFKVSRDSDSLVYEKNIEKILISRAWKGADVYERNPEIRTAEVVSLIKNKDGVACSYKLNQDQFFDSTVFYFKYAYNDIKYTLSKHFDSVYQAKLCRVESFRKKDRLRISFGIERDTVHNIESTIALFEKAIKMSRF